MIKRRSNVVRFVLLFEGRTGSSYFVESLRKMGHVRAEGEALVALKEKGWEAQREWIRDCLTPPPVTTLHAVGFKTKLRDIVDPEGFAELLDELQPKVLYMRRRNRIKAVVSMLRSRMLKERINDYNAYSKEQRLGPAELDPDLFHELLTMRERLDEELDEYVSRLRLPVTTLYYEDLLKDDDAFFRHACESLGIACRGSRSNTVKNTADDLRVDVINFDELRSRYVGTEYVAQFDD